MLELHRRDDLDTEGDRVMMCCSHIFGIEMKERRILRPPESGYSRIENQSCAVTLWKDREVAVHGFRFVDLDRLARFYGDPC